MFLDKDKLYDKYIRSNKFCANKMKLLHDIQISQKNLHNYDMRVKFILTGKQVYSLTCLK